MIDDSSTDKTNNGLGSKIKDGNLDQVSGYTIRQIEDALISVKTWNEWRDNIKDKYENATENNLDVLFEAWK